jgi:NTP pyrophosphatase (non-canonical NTP hydrolase)
VVNFNEYQDAAERTAPVDSTPMRLAVAAMGLAGESGELIDHLKKHLGHGHAIDRDYLRKEIGDTLWYLAEVCTCCNLSLDDAAQGNVAKLRKRYPEGFSSAASQARVDADEAPDTVRTGLTPQPRAYLP